MWEAHYFPTSQLDRGLLRLGVVTAQPTLCQHHKALLNPHNPLCKEPWGVSQAVRQRPGCFSKVYCTPETPGMCPPWQTLLFLCTWLALCESQMRTANTGPGWMVEPQGRGEGTRHREKPHRVWQGRGTHTPWHASLVLLNEAEAHKGRNRPTFVVPICSPLGYQLRADHLSWQTDKWKKPVTNYVMRVWRPFLTSNALTALLASVSIWITQAESQAQLPKYFRVSNPRDSVKSIKEEMCDSGSTVLVSTASF